MHFISRLGKATERKKFMMNVVIDQDESFWLDFELDISEWKLNRTVKILNLRKQRKKN